MSERDLGLAGAGRKASAGPDLRGKLPSGPRAGMWSGELQDLWGRVYTATVVLAAGDSGSALRIEATLRDSTKAWLLPGEKPGTVRE